MTMDSSANAAYCLEMYSVKIQRQRRAGCPEMHQGSDEYGRVDAVRFSPYSRALPSTAEDFPNLLLSFPVQQSTAVLSEHFPLSTLRSPPLALYSVGPSFA